MEAWLVDTEDGVLAVVISYALAEKDTQLARLYGILATLEIMPEDAEGWAEVTAYTETMARTGASATGWPSGPSPSTHRWP